MTTVLLVEDNELNRDMLSRRLAKKGFKVVIAVDGQAGVVSAKALAGESGPRLILMDMSLPVIDGWEAARQIKADPRARDIPMIALTAHAMSGDREKALEAGCDDYDTKPVDFDRLLGKMTALLNPVRKTGRAVVAAEPATPPVDRPTVKRLLSDAEPFAAPPIPGTSSGGASRRAAMSQNGPGEAPRAAEVPPLAAAPNRAASDDASEVDPRTPRSVIDVKQMPGDRVTGDRVPGDRRAADRHGAISPMGGSPAPSPAAGGSPMGGGEWIEA